MQINVNHFMRSKTDETENPKLKTHLSHDSLKQQMDTPIEELKKLRERIK